MLHTPLCRVMQLHRLIGPLCEASLNLTAPDGESLEPHPDCPFLAVERCFVSPRPLRPGTTPMASKYAFTKSLKEVRFLFCQTAEHSAATR